MLLVQTACERPVKHRQSPIVAAEQITGIGIGMIEVFRPQNGIEIMASISLSASRLHSRSDSMVSVILPPVDTLHGGDSDLSRKEQPGNNDVRFIMVKRGSLLKIVLFHALEADLLS